MLHHISIAVENPFRVAKVLGELTGGQFFEFPVTPGAYMVILNDAYGSALEILPKASVWMTGEAGAEIHTAELIPRFGAVHAALSVPVSRTTIETIAAREGWHVQWGDRGPFQVIELWIENCFMLELLTSEMTKAYLEFMKPSNYAAFLGEIAHHHGLAPVTA